MKIPLVRVGPVLALALAACTSGSEPSAPLIPPPEAPSATLSASHGVVQALGLGTIDLTAANAGYADFYFAALRTPDGKALGYFRQSRTREGLLIEFSGRVTCLTIDPAFPGRARIGGVVTENNSTDPAFKTANHAVGAHVWFRVTDGRAGGDAVDASTTYGFKPTLVNTSEEYCALPFTGLPAWNPASIFPLKRGLIVVSP